MIVPSLPRLADGCVGMTRARVSRQRPHLPLAQWEFRLMRVRSGGGGGGVVVGRKLHRFFL